MFSNNSVDVPYWNYITTLDDIKKIAILKNGIRIEGQKCMQAS